ncbi:alpha/beta hydrolase [Actinomadura barringtoniae]|uniref:Alpha/beta hydrolase n=1 Tax=Actinomadura barringtoniae TaxID=1427535 RepID=A0A939PE78_9ACTN|nr:alpha/beta hydrolase [Actinomadura barringtoniae]MBO2448488.1 alpha/beta hydrolase [Actinomadura barringtoniae]
MPHVISQDGTRIAYTKTGSGPAVVLVDGAFGHRGFGPNVDLAPVLAESHTVYAYDRRGRGDSGDTQPFSQTREIEDLEAVIAEAGGTSDASGPVAVYAISSGAPLALDAAQAGLPISKLVVYEAPFVVDDSRKPIPDDFLARLNALIAQDRRSEAITYFMTKGVALPGVFVMLMRLMPAWSKLKKVAHTVPYDVAGLGDTGAGKALPAGRWADGKVPTLVVAGGKSPKWMQNAMTALADVLPDARHRTLEGQMHIVKAKAIAPVITGFVDD